MPNTLHRLWVYFGRLSAQQQKQFAAMQAVYAQWNARMNLISRRDFEHFYLHHVLHSLSIAKVIDFAPQSKVLDVGTGGGLPGIPLAIYFPHVRFCLVESIQKKTVALSHIVAHLALNNVSVEHARVEESLHAVDYIVGRAVAPLPKLIPWLKGQFRTQHPPMNKRGLFYLGAPPTHTPIPIQSFPIQQHFQEPYFRTKKILYLPAKYLN